MITCKHGERNDDESCWNCENERKESAADLRERWDKAYFAALTGFCMNGERIVGIVDMAEGIANETIRRHADMMADRDKLIAEVAG